MEKPIFRWIIGNNSLPRGLDVLSVSILNAKKIYKDEFDWFICYNTNDSDKLYKIERLARKHQIKLYTQSWDQCPIPEPLQPDRSDGLNDHASAGGSMWKYCPARIKENVHEIICDNDIVLVKRVDEIDQFLTQKKVLLTQDANSFLGRYEDFQESEKTYNSGFIGLPPNYDFAQKIFQMWDKTQYSDLSYADEQGLITLVLSQ